MSAVPAALAKALGQLGDRRIIAVVATLLNGMVLLINTPAELDSHRDVLLSLLAQSLTGLLLGAGIQRQRELNYQLQLRLNENRELAKALVVAEEHARRDVARELHDEVGQTVTVIRTQASIIKRLTTQSQVLTSAEMVETLALRVYDGVHDVLEKASSRSYRRKVALQSNR